MNQVLKRAAVAVAATVGFLGIAAPAMAVNWGSASDPYYVKEGTVNQGKGYGDYGNYNNQYARNNMWFYDLRSGGEGIYVRTVFQFFYSNAGDAAAWQRDAYKETDRTTSAAWKFNMRQQALNSRAEKSRGVIRVCEDQTLSGDPCSPEGFISFSY